MANLNTYHLATWADSAKTRNPTRSGAAAVAPHDRAMAMARTCSGAAAFSGNAVRLQRRAAALERGGRGGLGGAARLSGTARMWRTSSPDLGEEREKRHGSAARLKSLASRLYRWQRRGEEGDDDGSMAPSGSGCSGKKKQRRHNLARRRLRKEKKRRAAAACNRMRQKVCEN
uniref:Uncharacterized protein n=1 Tax=Oryza punctata TaxID=4537 RepID=A0A0E0ML49_ORYPU